MIVILIISFVVITILLVLIIVYHETRKENIEESNSRGMSISFGSVLIPLFILSFSYLLFNEIKGDTKERGVKGNYEATELHYENEKTAFMLHKGFSSISMLIFIFYFDRRNRTIKSVIFLVFICIFLYYISYILLPSPKSFILFY